MSEIELVLGHDPHLFTEDGPREIPYYEFGKYDIGILDPVWGRGEIGRQPYDHVLIELSKNALVRRAMSIEQLTLDKYTATIPGTAEFSRWEHIWGSVLFVRKMCDSLGLDPYESMKLQLRTFVSDLGHTAYSHLGDWMFQGVGGSENQHDNELMHLLDVSGVSGILRSNDFEPQDIVFPEVQDWVECPSPDLCVDRIDYGAREIKRWLDLSVPVHYSVSEEAFSIDKNGRAVMRSHRDAINFAKAFLLLPTEHWNEPVHRLQLHLQELLVKRVLTHDDSGMFASDMSRPDRYYPRDYMYTFDFDITWEQVRSWDAFRAVTRTIMEDIGLQRRKNHIFQRKGQLAWLFSDYNKTPDLPKPLEPYGDGMYQGLPMLPYNIQIFPVNAKDDIEDFDENPRTFDVFLKDMKPRSVDPLYYSPDKKRALRLSKNDKNFARLLSQQREIMAQAYIARMYVNSETRAILYEGVSEIDRNWKKALERPRMGPAAFNRMLGETAMVGANHRFIRIGQSESGAFSFYPG